MQTPPPNLYEFGDFQLDTAKRFLRRVDGTPVPLTPRVFETLLYLVEHHDAVLDKERIMAVVWPDSIVEENNLAQAISKLRAQLHCDRPGSGLSLCGGSYRASSEVRRYGCYYNSRSRQGRCCIACSRYSCHHRSRRFTDSPFPRFQHGGTASKNWLAMDSRAVSDRHP